MKTLPRATLVHDDGCRKEWIVKWPSTMFKQGKVYRAYTYPDSELVTIFTAAKRRNISPLAGRRMTPIIRDAIIRAEDKLQEIRT